MIAADLAPIRLKRRQAEILWAAREYGVADQRGVSTQSLMLLRRLGLLHREANGTHTITPHGRAELALWAQVHPRSMLVIGEYLR